MPKDKLTAAQAWEDVTFFSIDTNLIQAAGYNFTRGALHQLPNQLPESIGLQLPEIVVSEIVKHRMEPVIKAHLRLQSASEDLNRLTTIDVAEVSDSVAKLNAIEVATQLFTQEAHNYAALCRGAVLPTAGADAVTSLFSDYFAQKPPFGLSEKKKSEFPDAMCLWQLDKYAKDNNTLGIIASDDKGWMQYAVESENLYCVGSIEELAALFAETNQHAESIRRMIEAAVVDVNSPLRINLNDVLNDHVAGAQWDASAVYTGMAQRVEAEVYDASVAEYKIVGSIGVWSLKGEPTSWIVELTVRVIADVEVSVEFFVWDSIDHEELCLGTQEFTKQETIDVEVFIICSDVHLGAGPNEWNTEIEIAAGNYSLHQFEAELDFGPYDD